MTYYAYMILVWCFYWHSQWIFNRCAMIGGHKATESAWADVLFGFNVPLTIWSLKTIFA